MDYETPRGRTLVRLNARTDLHNYYPESWQRRPENKRGKKESNTFSTKRTKYDALDVSKVHALIARERKQRAYLITHTTAPDFIFPGFVRPGKDVIPFDVNQHRRAAFRKLLDRLRKLPGYRGHFWTTELHWDGGANHGTIHHHCVMRHEGYWAYNKFIKQWSHKYCGSPNGLDVRASSQGRHAWEYLGKAWSYLREDLYLDRTTGELVPLVLPFRCWGTSKVFRKWTAYTDELHFWTDPVYLPSKHSARCARIARSEALRASAALTIAYELSRVQASSKLDTEPPSFVPAGDKPTRLQNIVL